MEVWLAIVGGGAGAAVVGGIFGLITWLLNRKAEKEDRRDDRADQEQKDLNAEIEEIKEQLGNLTVAQRTQMYDRIKHMAKSYIERGTITAEELEDLTNMHKVYHNELKGNGFLDKLMEKVYALPVVG